MDHYIKLKSIFAEKLNDDNSTEFTITGAYKYGGDKHVIKWDEIYTAPTF